MMAEVNRIMYLAQQAFLDAYEFSSFEQLLFYKLDQEFHEIVSHSASFSDQVFQVLKTALREGWFYPLILEGFYDNRFNDHFGLLVSMIDVDKLTDPHVQKRSWFQTLGRLFDEIIVCVVILLMVAIFALFAWYTRLIVATLIG